MFLKFKGSDWVGMSFGLMSCYFLTKERRAGFIFGVIGNSGWLAFSFLTGSMPGIVSNLLYIGINCRGYFRWKEKSENGTLGQPD